MSDRRQSGSPEREALERILGHFIPGQRQTYAPAAETLDMIRREAEQALAAGSLPTPVSSRRRQQAARR